MSNVMIMDCGKDYTGECTLKGYDGQIELMSMNHSILQHVTADKSNKKRTTGKPSHAGFAVNKYFDNASCQLIDACNTGKAIAKVKIVIGQVEQGEFNEVMLVEMDDVVIASISMGGGNAKPTETVMLDYTKIAWTYKPQQATGAVKGSNKAQYDLKTGTNK
ncbi:MAG: type VI secretion system tube protein Hcp [Bryobacteraceae bacterium]|jgi:type VI secretion system secreted protein Hcp